MAEQKESSVLFSLKELMNLEEDRIKQEEDERQRKVMAEDQARMEAERRTRDQEEARMNAEHERRRVDEQRTREEQARVEAIRHAEVERARLDAENAARMEAMRRQQEHEAQLVRIKEGTGKKKATMIAVGVGVLLVLGAVGGGVAFKINNDKAQAIQKQQQDDLTAKQAQLDKLMADLKAQSDQVDQLTGAVANAQSDKDRADAQARLLAARQAQATTQARVVSIQKSGGNGNTGSAPTKARPACTCQTGDPLCSCL
jgi:colicin import membrane protein